MAHKIAQDGPQPSRVDASDTKGGQVDPVLLRAEEAAALLRIRRSKMYGLLAAAAIPTVRIGRSVRVPRAALLAWIASRTVGPIAPEPPADMTGPAEPS